MTLLFLSMLLTESINFKTKAKVSNKSNKPKTAVLTAIDDYKFSRYNKSRLKERLSRQANSRTMQTTNTRLWKAIIKEEKDQRNNSIKHRFPSISNNAARNQRALNRSNLHMSGNKSFANDAPIPK